MSAIGNVISWYIGLIIMGIWSQIGMILGLVGAWQVGLDGVLGVVDSMKFEAMGSTYSNDLTYAV